MMALLTATVVFGKIESNSVEEFKILIVRQSLTLPHCCFKDVISLIRKREERYSFTRERIGILRELCECKNSLVRVNPFSSESQL